MSKVPLNRRLEAGFTLPELLSVMIGTVLFTGLIIFFAFTFWTSISTLENDMVSYVSRLNAGDLLRDSINESSGLIIQNSLADTHTLKADSAIPSGNYWTPIHAVPGTVTNTAGTYTPVVYYRSFSVDSSKNIIMNGTQPYEDEHVLFMNGTTKELLLRTIANPSATGNAAKSSCPRTIATATCPGDKLIAENVASIDMRYFSRSGNTINYQSIVDPNTGNYIGPDFPSVEVVEFNIKIFKKSRLQGGQDTSSQTVIRVALRSS